jgi:hypothetical protein
MTYYAKFGKVFYNRLIWLAYAVVWIVKEFDRLTYSDLVFVALGVVTFPTVIKVIYFNLFKKPIFIANAVYIFDCYNNVKYYWDDIKVADYKDDFLTIYLFLPEKYIKKTKNPFYWLLKVVQLYIFRQKSLYSINLNLLNIPLGKNAEFIRGLNELSMAKVE